MLVLVQRTVVIIYKRRETGTRKYLDIIAAIVITVFFIDDGQARQSKGGIPISQKKVFKRDLPSCTKKRTKMYNVSSKSRFLK